MTTFVDRSQESDPIADGADHQCIHCGLVASCFADSTGRRFCCEGCRGAFELIHQWGLQAYYDLRDETPDDRPIAASDAHFDDLDDPQLLGDSAPDLVRTEPGRKWLRCKLSVSGLHCAACVWLLEQSPRRMNGWESTRVNLHDRTIEIVFDPDVTRLSSIGRLIHRLGYQVTPYEGATGRESFDADDRGMLVDIAVAGFCAANAMWIAIALYAGQWTGMSPTHVLVLRLAGVLLGFVAVAVPGRIFFRGALSSIWARSPHMDLPVALGLSAGTLASFAGVLDVSRDVYFDSIAGLVFFLLCGRWLQQRQQRRAGNEVAELMRLAPRAADRVAPSGQIERVPLDRLKVGDRIRVRPGESIPADGVVDFGETLVDCSLLTGESRPIPIEPGDRVEAGTDNVQSMMILRATAVGQHTRLAALHDAVSGAAASRTPVVQFANRVGGWFVMAVLVLASITIACWWRLDPKAAVSNSISLLIVACPCALALATPLAIAITVGRLASRRVLVRSAEALERLDHPGTVFFDKTGTLTEGKMALTHRFDEHQLLPIIAEIERSIPHPIAMAIAAAQTRDSAMEITDVQQNLGQGVSAIAQGAHWRIGTETWAVSPDNIAPRWRQRADQIRASGSSPIWVTRDRDIVAMFGVSDPIRRNTTDVIGRLRAMNWRVHILSGDDPATVQQIAGQLDLAPAHAQGGLLPEDKMRVIEMSMRSSPRTRVIMVGDGLNDAAALAAADVGIAMRGGASASLESAPIMIAQGGLPQVLSVIEAANTMRRVIRRNLTVSIGYNVLAVGLCMNGAITPLIAAALMPISSLSVIAMTVASRANRTFHLDAPETDNIRKSHGSSDVTTSRIEVSGAMT